MSKIPFNENEMNIAYTVPNLFDPTVPESPAWTYPQSEKDAIQELYAGTPTWCPSGLETGLFAPSVIPDNIARGFVIEGIPYDMAKYGGPDMFGVEWEYVPVAGGSMVRPGAPLLEDVNDWRKILKFPNIDEWDWDASGRKNYKFLQNGKANMLWFLNGCWYERLVSFMDFEGAVVALIDDEQKDALKELFAETTELYCRLVDRCVETYGDGISGFTVHDDWGSQRAPFFSPAVGEEMIVPYMRQLTDHIKSKGMIADLHSCGSLEMQLPNFIKAGWQSWCPMPMNPTQKMYEEYGDKILLHVEPDLPEGASEEEQEKAGEEFVRNYFKPGKYCFPNTTYFPKKVTPAFRKGMYRASRQ